VNSKNFGFDVAQMLAGYPLDRGSCTSPTPAGMPMFRDHGATAEPTVHQPCRVVERIGQCPSCSSATRHPSPRATRQVAALRQLRRRTERLDAG
jgi:hypothetical protein